MVYDLIKNKLKSGKLFSVLIDPDKYDSPTLEKTIDLINPAGVDLIFVGGSLVSNGIDSQIESIRNKTDIPVLLFPGSLLQISEKAHAILLLSLISGRNPEFLIGNQVVAAPVLKKSGIEIISTGYILIHSGKLTSVEYMSNTRSIPYEKIDIAVATAMAGEMLGNKLIYMDAGSGAPKTISGKMIRAVKNNISVPLVIGGGIRTKEKIIEVCESGADIIVVGNAIEKDKNLIKEFAKIIHKE
ncbi:geranylgeranylglyceryl/heptaprenylglyceryl phosphate synthase [Bacteroidota bacterium]